MRNRTGYRIFVAIVLLWLFEGVLRKWVAPSLSQILFFLRDPLLLWLTVLALRDGSARLARWRTLALGVALTVITFAPLVAIVGNVSLSVTFYGIRMYLGWLLLGVSAASLLCRDDVLKIMGWLRNTAPAMAVLGLVQGLSPATAAINSIGDPNGTVLTTSDGVVRTTLTFTSPTGAIGYISLILVLMVTSRADGWYGRWIVPPSCILLAATSGSRGVIFLAVAVFAVIIMMQFLASPAAAGKLSIRVAIVALAGFEVATRAAPDVIAAFEERFRVASEQENTGERFLGDLLGFWYAMPQSSALGHGVGAHSRGAVLQGGTQWAEGDLARNVLELGFIFGLVFVFFRWAVLGVLVTRSLPALFKGGEIAPVGLVACIFPIIGWGQITGQGSVQAFAGIVMAFILVLSTEPKSPELGLLPTQERAST